MKQSSVQLAWVFSCCLLIAGCNHHSGHSDSETLSAPKLSLQETLDRINKLAEKIGEGMADGEVEKAHDPMHKIVHMLEGVPKMIDVSTLDEKDKQELQTAVEDLIKSFGAVDAKMHGSDKGSDYAEVQDKIAESLVTVNKVSKSL